MFSYDSYMAKLYTQAQCPTGDAAEHYVKFTLI